MPVAWYIVPYKIETKYPWPTPDIRYPAIDDYTKQIRDSGGDWSETEVSNNRAVVKVRASQTILDQLAAVFTRLPKNRLDDSLSNLPQTIKNRIKSELADMGYSLSEIRDRFGDDLGSYTLRDVLRFATQRRIAPRYHPDTESFTFDGPEKPCKPIEAVDEKVK